MVDLVYQYISHHDKAKKVVNGSCNWFCICRFLFVIGISIIKTKIEQRIQNYYVGSFELESKTVDVDVLRRRITIGDIQFCDSLCANSILARKVEISGIRIVPLIFKNKITVGTVSNDSADIRIETGSELDFGNSNRESEKQRTILLKNIKLSNASIIINKNDTTGKDTLFYTDLDVELNDLTSSLNYSKYDFSKGGFGRLKITLTNGGYFFENTLYKIGYQAINFDSNDSAVIVKNGNLISNDSKYEIAKKTGAETDWLDIGFEQFKISGIDLAPLLGKNQFIAGTTKIEKLEIETFRDKNPPFPEKPDTKLPMDLFYSLAFGIHCDSIFIVDAEIKYSERKAKSAEEGEITFNNLQATFANVSNIESLIAGPTSILVKAKPNNAALSSVDFEFPNKKIANQYKATGSLESMDLTEFNSIVKPSYSAEIKSGKLKHCLSISHTTICFK